MKGIKREFSVARTPQQNRVAERKNRTLIEAARTMLADSKLPTTFWAEVVTTACYVQNRVLVIKPRNKTPYEIFLGRKPALSFMRPFGCPVTILNTIDHLGKARMETVPGKDYILLPVWHADLLFSQSSKDFPDAGSKPSGEKEKKDAKDPRNEDSEVPSTEESRVNQENDASVNSTNTINTVSLTVNVAGIEDNVVDENIVYGCADDPNMPELEDIVYSDDAKDVGAEADMNNLDIFMPVSPISTTRTHKDHPIEQIIKDLKSAPQTRRMTKKEPKKVIQALKDPSWIEAMQEELLQFKLQQVWTLMDLPKGKRVVGTKWVYRNKKDEKDFVVYQMDVKSAFLYGKIEEEVYVCQPSGFEDPDFLDRVYKVEKALYRLHQALKAWYKTLSTYLLDNGFQRGKIEKTLFIRRDKDDKIHIDNESTICIVKNPVFHSKTKHIEIRHHFIRDSNEKKLIQMIKIHTDQNVTDLLTKAFDVSRFEYLIASIRMLNL
ncbi:putative ribonuclease H-like domain-containing protein [Tanacetum coccineum]